MLLRNGIVVGIFTLFLFSLTGCQPEDPKSSSDLDTIYYQDNDFFEFNGSDTYIMDVIPQVSKDGIEYYCAYFGSRQNSLLWEEQSEMDLIIDKWSIYAGGDQRWQSEPLDPAIFHGPNNQFRDGISWSKTGSYLVPMLATGAATTAGAVGTGLTALLPFLGAWHGAGWAKSGKNAATKSLKGVGGALSGGVAGTGASIATIVLATPVLAVGAIATGYFAWKSGAHFVTSVGWGSHKNAVRNPEPLQKVDSWGAFNKTLNTMKTAMPMGIDASCPAANDVLRKVKSHRDLTVFSQNLAAAKTFTFKTANGQTYQIVRESADNPSLTYYEVRNGKQIRAQRQGQMSELMKAFETGLANTADAEANEELLLPKLLGFWGADDFSTTMSADTATVGALPQLFETLTLHVQSHF